MLRLPLSAPLEHYRRQALSQLDAWQAGDRQALEFFRQHHPRRAERFDEDDARLALARWYDFADWAALAALVEALERRDAAIYPFECAADAVVEGDAAELRRWLAVEAGLVRARSTRVTTLDPPVHGATLLHYVAANGVEGYRQKSPANAVEVARLLLDAGADVDALARCYGSECTTLSLLVSSRPPAEAGVQVELVELLVDFGAALTPPGEGNWTSPVETALVFGNTEAARALVRRGAPRTVAAAAGLGLGSEVGALLAGATALDRHRGPAIAALRGEVEAARLLLEAGEDPNRYNPAGTHAHSTPLHQAALAGHLDMVRLLLAGGARLDVRDTVYESTPLGWAKHGGQAAVAAVLREAAGE